MTCAEAEPLDSSWEIFTAVMLIHWTFSIIISSGVVTCCKIFRCMGMCKANAIFFHPFKFKHLKHFSLKIYICWCSQWDDELFLFWIIVKPTVRIDHLPFTCKEQCEWVILNAGVYFLYSIYPRLGYQPGSSQKKFLTAVPILSFKDRMCFGSN